MVSPNVKDKKQKTVKRNSKDLSADGIAVIDFETDPFKFGREPLPFCAGYYSLDSGFVYFWGDDCVFKLCSFISQITKPMFIYSHNGGKFDLHFMLRYLNNPIKIINSRIVEVGQGIHTHRDSYCILPIPLRAYAKEDIDYSKMERENREENKEEILEYLKTDCLYLFDLVSGFIQRFGNKLTVGSAAIAELRKIHPFENTNIWHDMRFRDYYFGGRVECFETGVIEGDFKIYDVNSMYSWAMKHCFHPIGKKYLTIYKAELNNKGEIIGHESAKFYFANIKCRQRGAFPTRIKGEALSFNIELGEFKITSHELKAAIELGLISELEIISVMIPETVIKFDEFVDKFFAEKVFFKKSGDRAQEIFAKLMLNSPYGKFSTNPDRYEIYSLGKPGDGPGWSIYSGSSNSVKIWAKDSPSKTYFDVAVGASVTGAARAKLMRGINKATRPIYCDTDSLICEELNSDEISAVALGGWKFEGAGDLLAIHSKKVYALFKDGEEVKKACKGIKATAREILKIASGENFIWRNDAPSFSLTKKINFISREVNKVKKERVIIHSPQ